MKRKTKVVRQQCDKCALKLRKQAHKGMNNLPVRWCRQYICLPGFEHCNAFMLACEHCKFLGCTQQEEHWCYFYADKPTKGSCVNAEETPTVSIEDIFNPSVNVPDQVVLSTLFNKANLVPSCSDCVFKLDANHLWWCGLMHREPAGYVCPRHKLKLSGWKDGGTSTFQFKKNEEQTVEEDFVEIDEGPVELDWSAGKKVEEHAKSIFDESWFQRYVEDVEAAAASACEGLCSQCANYSQGGTYTKPDNRYCLKSQPGVPGPSYSVKPDIEYDWKDDSTVTITARCELFTSGNPQPTTKDMDEAFAPMDVPGAEAGYQSQNPGLNGPVGRCEPYTGQVSATDVRTKEFGVLDELEHWQLYAGRARRWTYPDLMVNQWYKWFDRPRLSAEEQLRYLDEEMKPAAWQAMYRTITKAMCDTFNEAVRTGGGLVRTARSVPKEHIDCDSCVHAVDTSEGMTFCEAIGISPEHFDRVVAGEEKCQWYRQWAYFDKEIPEHKQWRAWFDRPRPTEEEQTQYLNKKMTPDIARLKEFRAAVKRRRGIIDNKCPTCPAYDAQADDQRDGCVLGFYKGKGVLNCPQAKGEWPKCFDCVEFDPKHLRESCKSCKWQGCTGFLEKKPEPTAQSTDETGNFLPELSTLFFYRGKTQFKAVGPKSELDKLRASAKGTGLMFTPDMNVTLHMYEEHKGFVQIHPDPRLYKLSFVPEPQHRAQKTVRISKHDIRCHDCAYQWKTEAPTRWCSLHKTKPVFDGPLGRCDGYVPIEKDD